RTIRRWIACRLQRKANTKPAGRNVAQAHRELVADELAAAAGENGWKVSETCPLLLATVGGEPPDETVVCQHAPADCRAVASGRIAGAAGTEKSIQSQEGTEECLTKPDGKALVSRFGTWVGPCGPCAEPGGQPQRENGALDSLKGCIVWGCWEPKRKFRLLRQGQVAH